MVCTILGYCSFLTLFLFFILPPGHLKAPKCSTFSLPPIPLSVTEENKQLTRQINRHVKLWQLGVVPVIPKVAAHNMNLSLALLDLVTAVVKSACPDHYVPHMHLLDGALHAFAFLHDNTGDIRYFGDPISPSMYSRISPALIACQKSAFPHDHYFSSGENNGCPLTASTIREVCFRDGGYDLDVAKCTKLKLRQEKRGGTECFQNTNLFIDVIWSMIEIVHLACFKEFQKRDDISAFHLWEQASEGLFTRKIRKYWYQAPLSAEMYQTVLHPNVRQQIFNLEMCLEGISHLTQSKIPRLQRPTYPLMTYGKRRRKRSNKED